jgi:hypothetical protein
LSRSSPIPDAGAALIAAAGGLRLAIRLTPKASRNQVGDVVAEADGTMVLKAMVTAVPEDGKANAALIALLAKAWKIPKSSISIVTGATDRRKVLFIGGDAEDLRHRITGHGGPR